MLRLSNLTLLGASLLTLGLAASRNVSVSAQTAFTDVPADYWAEPFIQRMAQRNIVVGYPDGTFRPEQPVKREEFAAMIRKAFEQEQVRQIPSGSVYKDVPQGYWAAPAIEEATEQGFMSGNSNNSFRPNQPVSRVEAIVALNQGLNLSPQNSQVTTRRTVKKPIYFPLAITSLMQPIVRQASQNVSTTTATSSQATASPSTTVENYYTDAEKIPQSAMDEVGIATQRNLVVNHPNPRVFNPNRPLRRATAAAFIHQTLVAQDRIEPLPSNVEAYNYIVQPGVSDTNAQATR